MNKSTLLGTLVLCLWSGSSHSMELPFRSICEVKQATDAMYYVRIESARNLCTADCVANFYEATVRSASDGDATNGSKQRVTFVSVMPVNVGYAYLVFLERWKERRIQVEVGLHDYREIDVPDDAQYYLPIDGAFGDNGTGLARLVLDGCYGDGKDCEAFYKVRDAGAWTAVMSYPDARDELRACK